MNNFPPFLTKKKIIIIGIGLCVVVIFCGILMTSQTTPKTLTQKQPTAAPSPTTPTESTVIATKTPSQGPHWPTYNGSTFHIQYPPDWIVQSFPIGNTDVSLNIRPSVLPPGINYPQFELQTETYSEQGIQMKMGILEGFHMTKSTSSVGHDSAIKYTGTIPYKIVGSNITQDPIQDTTVLVHKGSKLYVLKYEYDGDTPNGALNDYFDDFIASFGTTE